MQIHRYISVNRGFILQAVSLLFKQHDAKLVITLKCAVSHAQYKQSGAQQH